jgi:hypothetical protein
MFRSVHFQKNPVEVILDTSTLDQLVKEFVAYYWKYDFYYHVHKSPGLGKTS